MFARRVGMFLLVVAGLVLSGAAATNVYVKMDD